ncbi:hypothetical protein EK21DRAFT_56584 [Setomelanomma holmii]|uniref:Tim44-like domain-containing protein n=1 Tax=Setomelanomma holmii TaxID=210430 RepID=A0A9P4LNY9_9PLEO|nr:hypothetical protein EK21DRAFT_56584 [Setomelanomma holmii]
MSSKLPLRRFRIPALQRQCLFQHRRHLQSPRAFSTTTPQHLTATSPRLRGQGLGRQDKSMTRAAVRGQQGPAPRVNMEKAQQDMGSLAEDIGLLQDTIIRARFSKIPAPWSLTFWGYYWKLLKSKATALYSRGAYNRCLFKRGFWSYMPVERFDGTKIKDIAKKHYEQIYSNFAKGNVKDATRFALPPLARNLKNRIEARGSLQMDWKLQKCSARIVSHRASLMGDDLPDTAFRQAVIRLDTTQVLTMTPGKDGASKSKSSKPSWTPYASKSSSPKGLRWKPENVKVQAQKDGPETTSIDFVDNGVPKKVVEYLVMQRRVVKGKEEDWKIWGFAQESTPEVIEEDEAYWRKTMAAQAEQAA